jgi:arsenate reductase
MAKRKRILFLCTGNSCRSQMAEALLRQIGGDRFEALSAGSHPAGYVFPLAIQATWELDVPLEGQTSKSWDEYADTPIDVVITLCDAAAAETCPVWVGSPITTHWSLSDPAGYPGTEEERLAFAISIAKRLRAKIQGLVELDWSADIKELKRRLDLLGEI